MEAALGVADDDGLLASFVEASRHHAVVAHSRRPVAAAAWNSQWQRCGTACYSQHLGERSLWNNC